MGGRHAAGVFCVKWCATTDWPSLINPTLLKWLALSLKPLGESIQDMSGCKPVAVLLHGECVSVNNNCGDVQDAELQVRHQSRTVINVNQGAVQTVLKVEAQPEHFKRE